MKGRRNERKRERERAQKQMKETDRITEIEKKFKV